MLRRIGTWVLALLMLAVTAQGATLCVNVPGVVALTDARGNELIPNGSVEDIFTVRADALYAAGSRGAYRLYDAEGQPLSDVEFGMIDDAGKALVFRQGTLYGAMDARGEVILPAQWTQLTADGAGGWLALEGDPFDEQADEIIHLSEDGTARPTGVYTASGLRPVSCGRMPFLGDEGRWGAVDGGGHVVIDPTWRYIGPFEGGCAKASGERGMGLIDIDGRALIAPVYDWLERGESLVAARRDIGLDIYPPRGGARQFHLAGSVGEVAVVGSGFVVADEGRSRLYGAKGQLLAEGEAGTLWVQGGRGHLIEVCGAWGERSQRLVSLNGKAESGRFQQLLPLCDGRYAWLSLNGVEYYSAELRRTQKSWDYANLRYGLADGSGRILLSARYREIRALGEEHLLLVGDDRVQLSDRNGAVLKTWFISETEAPSGEAAVAETP